jgi:hypothetical protein
VSSGLILKRSRGYNGMSRELEKFSNSPMSSGLILKMSRGYNGVSRELEKFTW